MPVPHSVNGDTALESLTDSDNSGFDYPSKCERDSVRNMVSAATEVLRPNMGLENTDSNNS